MALKDMFAGSFGTAKEDPKVTQLKNEIESLSVRKSAAISVKDKEIATLKQNKTSILLEAGEKKYEAWKLDPSTITDLTEYWDKIKQLEEEMASKEEKAKVAVERYDEEIVMLKNEISFLNVDVPNNSVNISASSTGTGRVCANCGVSLKEDSVFCTNCGTRVE